MILLHRIGMHCSGISAWIMLRVRGHYKQANILTKGLLQYYILYPGILFFLTRSWSFIFYMYFQPFVGMTFFLCFMNVAFHAFVEYENDKPVECVYHTDMIGGDDDYFGENSHMSHHIATHVYWRDLDEARKSLYSDFAKYHGAIFKDLSIVEVAGMLLFKDFKTLAKHFVQFNDAPAPNKLPTEELIRRGREDLSATTKTSVWVGQGRLTLEEVEVMLETRAKRREPKWLRL